MYIRIFAILLFLMIIFPTFVVGVASCRDNDNKEKENHISFPEQGIDVQCPRSAPLFDRRSDLFTHFNDTEVVVRVTGCTGNDYEESEIYGYNATSRQLLYVAKMSGKNLTNLTFHVRPDTRSDLDYGVVQKCGNRTVSIDQAPFSYTYAFPCTTEVGAVPVPENTTVTMSTILVHETTLRLRYDVSCGEGCKYTVERVESGSWRVVSAP